MLTRSPITRSQPSREVRRQSRRFRFTDPVNLVGMVTVTIFAASLAVQWWMP